MQQTLRNADVNAAAQSLRQRAVATRAVGDDGSVGGGDDDDDGSGNLL